MKKLGRIQIRLEAPKDCYNDFANYKYRNAEGILEAVKPLLNEEGLTLTLSDDVVNHGDRFYIKATVRLDNPLDNETFEVSALAREELTLKGQIAAQISGGCSSYARKYALSGLFCIDDSSSDPDSNEQYQKNTQQGNEQITNMEAQANWYNDFKAHKSNMIKKIQSGEQTAQGIIDALRKSGLAVSKKTQQQILELK